MIRFLAIWLIAIFSWANQVVADVEKIQFYLNELGYNAGHPDGIWGKKTESAIKQFLSDRHIDWDGVLDSNDIQIVNYEYKKLNKASDNDLLASTCDTVAKICSDEQLCEMASFKVNGKILWRLGYLKEYTEEAKSRGLTCDGTDGLQKTSIKTIQIDNSKIKFIQKTLSNLNYGIRKDGIWDDYSSSVLQGFYSDHRIPSDNLIDIKDYQIFEKIYKGLDSELANENQYRAWQPKNLCCGNLVVGNFYDKNKLSYIMTSPPQKYVDLLWGTKNPDYSKAFRLAKSERWGDEITLMKLGENYKVKKINADIQRSDNFCLHAASLSVGDFNSDGLDDVLIACHGFDGPPWPGSDGFVLISKSRNQFSLKKITDQKGYYHGATYLDVNGDQKLDIVLADAGQNRNVSVRYGDGKGNFSEDEIILKDTRVFSISSYDFNFDGRHDLIIGGHEHEGKATQIIYNNGKGKFNKSGSLSIPKNKSFPVVLDFLVHRNYLFIVRTKRNYKGGAIQQIDLNSLQQVGLLSRDKGNHIGKMRLVSSSGNGEKIKFGSLDTLRAEYDFLVDTSGKMSFEANHQ